MTNDSTGADDPSIEELGVEDLSVAARPADKINGTVIASDDVVPSSQSFPSSPPAINGQSFIGESLVGAFLTDRGLNPGRPVNEDACGIRSFLVGGREVVLAYVSDGMGGMESGEVASQAAGESFLSEGPTPTDLLSGDALADWVVERVSDANTAVIAAMGGANGGCTFTGIVAVETTIALAHVGDSRAYFYGGGRCMQISSDHSLVNALVRSGQLTPEQALISPERNVILRSLGQHDDFNEGYVDDLSVEGVFGPKRIFALQPGEGVLLVSDGVWGEVDDDAILDLVSTHEKEPGEIVRALIQASLDAGAPDNCSAVVLAHRPGLAVINPLTRVVAKPLAPAVLPSSNPAGRYRNGVLPLERPDTLLIKSSVAVAVFIAVLMAVGLGVLILHVGSGKTSPANSGNRSNTKSVTSSGSASTTARPRRDPSPTLQVPAFVRGTSPKLKPNKKPVTGSANAKATAVRATVDTSTTVVSTVVSTAVSKRLQISLASHHFTRALGAGR